VNAEEAIQPVPFGSYALLERLAMGGMAEVFLARPDGQDRLVAVKRILPNIAADDEFVAMFIDEAKIAGQLQHANIAAIIDIGRINGSYFIAMEYVSGHDLRALWDRTRDAAKESDDPVRGLPLGICCHVVKKLAEGLDFAHRRRDAKGRPLGIIHRDVSPQNILISYEGDVKIIDFGVAKAANRLAKTQTGILKGKFAYMAPEQARGEPVDHRSDIFAIGVVLYELLTGERAFRGDTDFALLERVRRVDVQPPKQLRPDLPKELERIVLKALGREAGDRYPWASALAADLDRFMSDQGIMSSREELAAYVRRTFREEHAEEVRRLSLYRRAGNSSSRERPRVVESNGATVVRGGPPAKNGVRVRNGMSADGHEPTALGDDIDADASQMDTALAVPTAPASPALDPRSKKPKSTRELAELRDQAARVARGELSESASAREPAPEDPGVVSSPSRRQRRQPPPEASAFQSEQPPPLPQEPSLAQPSTPATSLPSAHEQSRPSGSRNGVVVVACLLGAGLGAGLGVGVSMATRAPPPDALIVATPRQTEVKRGDVVVCTQTPCAVHLGRGRHSLLFTAPGAEAVTRDVDVGEVGVVVDVTLERMARAIRIESEPPGATVLLDDVPLSDPTPTVLPPLVVGKQVHLVLTREGFEPLSAVRTVEGDVPWRFDLPTPTTTWTLTSQPDDALIDAGAKEGGGKLVVVAGRKPLSVTVSRPGCLPKTFPLGGVGKATAAQEVKLECRDFDAKVALSTSKKPAFVKIDGVLLPKSADLNAYPMPSGTWSVQVVSPRGKRDQQTVEARRGETTLVVSKVK
jgi:serine/threonine protein kinase